jgi:broad specificity phosphatase PhoE
MKRYAGQQDIEVVRFPEKIEQIAKIQCDPIVLISPMKRCQQTLLHIESLLGYHFKDILVLEDLRERHLGIWENRLKSDIMQVYSEYFTNGVFDFKKTPPEGESFFEINNRVESVIRIINKIDCKRQILICSHNQLMKVLVSQLFQFDFTQNFDFINGKIYNKHDLFNDVKNKI